MIAFATPDAPLRCSATPSLRACPGFLLSRSREDVAGAAAQTGSAAHRVIQLAHEGWVLAEAFRQAQAEGEKWPDADWSAVATWSGAYCADPRNGPASLHGPVQNCEFPVSLAIPPDPADPTGQPVCVRGSIDQVRLSDGCLRVWDIKSSRGAGDEILATHAWQIAVYAAALAATTGKIALPGGIIRLRDYDRKGANAAGVFYELPMTAEDVGIVLAGIAHEVAQIRMGKVAIRPGLDCQWCPAAPFWDCWKRIEVPA